MILDCSQIQQHKQAVDFCALTSGQIRSGQFHEAIVTLQKLKLLVPKAKWIVDTISQIQKAYQAQWDLQAGPLCERILDDVERFAETGEAQDDRTVVVGRVR